ncbi:MAG: tetratricopeptide repeat protein [Xanthobacteraceae bacterium]
MAQSALKRYAEALVGYEHALTLCPDHADALTNRGVALHELGRLDEALKSYDHALALRPDDAEALSNRGHTLHELERYEESLASCDRALLLQPDLADAYCNRGNALNAVQRFDEALVSCDQALALRPDNAKALTNRGIALHALKRFDDEMASYARALAVEPDYADAHFNAGWCRMLHGDFRGFKDYEWRWKIDRLKSSKRDFARPHWTGADDGANKTVFLHAEQGFGDTIQFCRYVPLVAQRAGRLILEVQEPLRDPGDALPGVTQVISRGETLPDFDVHCPLLSLPLLMETQLATIPSHVPYLGARPQGVAEWGARAQGAPAHWPRLVPQPHAQKRSQPFGRRLRSCCRSSVWIRPM